MNQHVAHWLSEYIDEELGEAERREVARHLAECGSCKSVYLDLLDIHHQLADTYHHTAVPADLERRILRSLQQTAREPQPQTSSWAFLSLAAAAGLLLVLFIKGSLSFRMLHIAMKVCVNLLYTGGDLIAGAPILAWGTVLVSLGLIAGSGWILHRLLKSGAAWGERRPT